MVSIGNGIDITISMIMIIGSYLKGYLVIFKVKVELNQMQFFIFEGMVTFDSTLLMTSVYYICSHSIKNQLF